MTGDEIVGGDEPAEADDPAGLVGRWEWNVASGEVTWNAAVYALYGVPPGTKMTYDTYRALIHADDRAIAEHAIARAQDADDRFEFAHRVVRPDGSERVIRAAGYVVRAANGRPVRMIGSSWDMTGQGRAAGASEV